MDKQAMARPRFTIAAREAAFLSLLDPSVYISDFLNGWKAEANPSPADFHLAQQIAFGACQMKLALDFQATLLSKKKKLSLKNKEKILLRLALYQFYYLQRIPIYAIANEMTALAKKYCHPTFVSFLNAILRNMESIPLNLPQNNSIEALSIRYSYPSYFIEELLKQLPLEGVIEVLEAGNTPAPLMARIRHTDLDPPSSMITITDTSSIAEISSSPKYYIQNSTPVTLMWQLFQLRSIANPTHILDLCSSPGGKLLLLHDLFPNVTLYANDVSEEKMISLRENCLKYNIPAQLSISPGELYPPTQRFDIIVIDAPCSNSGVLNKRSEARWRLTPENIASLRETQQKLIQHAKTLLKPHGEIWYLTCSILKSETLSDYIIYPTRLGSDGGSRGSA